MCKFAMGDNSVRSEFEKGQLEKARSEFGTVNNMETVI